MRIPELFSLLYQLRKTGILTLVTARDERAFLLNKGNVAFATARDGTRRLGSYLVRLGLVSQGDVNAVTQKALGSETFLGQKLVETGRVSTTEMNVAVKEQIMDLMDEVLHWTNGAFHFDDNDIPFAIPDAIPVSTHSIILEATSRADEKQFARSLLPDWSVILAKAPVTVDSQAAQGEGGPQVPPTAAQSVDEEHVLELVDGTRPIEEILHISPLTEMATASALHALAQRGVIVPVPPRGADRSPPVDLPCLPVAPNVPGHFFAALNCESHLLVKLTDVVAQDPVLTAKVLRMAALGGAEISRAQIGVAQLVTRLGLHQVRSILIPEALRGLFFSSPESFWKECWEHSILCAQLCRLIASWVQYPHPEEAYLCGLLHNIGMFALMNHDPANYRKVVVNSTVTKQDLETIESEVFGMSHTGLGGALAEKWGFPKTVASAIKGHHKVDVHVTNPVLSILCTSLGIVEENGVRVGYTRGSEDQFNIALKRLNLHRKQAMSLVSRVPRVTTCLTP